MSFEGCALGFSTNMKTEEVSADGESIGLRGLKGKTSLKKIFLIFLDPPLSSIQATWSSLFRTSKTTFRAMSERKRFIFNDVFPVFVLENTFRQLCIEKYEPLHYAAIENN